MKLNMETGQIINETATVCGWSEYIGIHALAPVVNAMSAADSFEGGTGIQIMYPSRSDKSAIYKIEKNIRKECKRRGIEILESRIFEMPLICVPFVTVESVSAVKGKRACAQKEQSADERQGGKISLKGKSEGKDIVLSKWIGVDGMLQAAREKAEELERRFTPAFIRQIMSYEKELFAGRELPIAREMGVFMARQITRGGIFAALWEISAELHTGFELDMKRFSILQETVEVCEHFRLNPYRMTSAGCFLYVTENGEALKEALLKEGIISSVIGRTTDVQDKIIRNGEDVRFLDRPAPDEIWKLYGLEE